MILPVGARSIIEKKKPIIEFIKQYVDFIPMCKHLINIVCVKPINRHNMAQSKKLDPEI